MDRLVWNAAHRLACLVVGALALVGALLVRDTLLHHGAVVAEISAGSAAYLVVAALVAMNRARHFFARAEEMPWASAAPYRRNARLPAGDVWEPERVRATRCAAGALAALAVAGTFVIVAAASR